MVHCNFVPLKLRRKRIGIGSLTGITRAQSLTFNAFINNILRSARLTGSPVSFEISIQIRKSLEKYLTHGNFSLNYKYGKEDA
jgi:hypothetical protein